MFSTHAYDEFTVVSNPPNTIIKLQIGTSDIVVNGTLLDTDATTFKQDDFNLTFVPIRYVGEGLNYTVDWIAETRQVILTDGETTLILTIDSKQVFLNDDEISLDVALLINQQRTFLPVEFMNQMFNINVYWDHTEGVIVLTQ